MKTDQLLRDSLRNGYYLHLILFRIYGFFSQNSVLTECIHTLKRYAVVGIIDVFCISANLETYDAASQTCVFAKSEAIGEACFSIHSAFIALEAANG